jgi:integrase
MIFHKKLHPDQLGDANVEAFLTSLATNRQVAGSTQNQALAAVLFLYDAVLGRPLDGLPGIVHATTPARLPVVLSRDEVRRLLSHLSGTPTLVATLLYGGGLRLSEALSLRVKDIDFDRAQIVVRQGKGRKDRQTMLPGVAAQAVRDHLERCGRPTTSI